MGIFTALYTSQTILTAIGLMHGPDKPPVIVDSFGFLLSISIAIPRKVFTSETESAPAPSTARAISLILVTLGDNLTIKVLGNTSRTARVTFAAWTHGMGNGRAWTNSMSGNGKETTAQLVLSKSTDDGKTWSEPINITEQVKDPSWNFLLQGPGKGITMEDGTLVFAIQFIDSERMPNAGIMYSKDHGETWKIHNPARSNTTEAQVVEVEPGVLMLNMRDNRGGSRAVAITTDLGKTWKEHPSSRSVLQEPVCMASLISVKAEDNIIGKDILLFSNPNTTKGRNNITIKASLDGGLTFPTEYDVLLDEDYGWGYSCLTMIDEETVGILYESSVAHMTFQAVKLTDLIK
jgi:sialidase-1